MAFELKENSGSAFKNTRKREGKTDPDYTGQALIAGVEYWIDIWIKNDPRKPNYDPQKKTFLSHSFREKEEQQGEPTRAAEKPQTRHAPPPPLPKSKPPDDDTASDKDIPF